MEKPQVNFVIEQLKKAMPSAKRIRCIFSSEKHGWKTDDFHKLCDDKGCTLTLMRTSKQYLCGGFTSVPWASPTVLSGMFTLSGWNRPDPTAFLFALTGKMQVFKPGSVDNAVYHYQLHGPYF